MTASTTPDDGMPAEIDFSKGGRGKFHRAGATLHMPVYLDDEVQSFLTERARAKGMEVAVLVNSPLRKDIELIQSVAQQARPPHFLSG